MVATPPWTVPQASSEPRFTHSLAAPFKKEMCFFCQEDTPSQDINEVSTFTACEQLQNAVEESNNETWKGHLSTAFSADDANAIDIKYHLACLVKHVQHAPNKGREGRHCIVSMYQKNQTLASLHHCMSLSALWEVSSRMAQLAWPSYALPTVWTWREERSYLAHKWHPLHEAQTPERVWMSFLHNVVGCCHLEKK